MFFTMNGTILEEVFGTIPLHLKKVPKIVLFTFSVLIFLCPEEKYTQ